jgi:uncharacterized coiled-coil DUF342 family protein
MNRVAMRESMAAESKDKLKQALQIQKQIEKLQHKSDVLNAEINLLKNKSSQLREEIAKLMHDAALV